MSYEPAGDSAVRGAQGSPPDSLIGHGLSVDGNISTEGNLHVDGMIKGVIRVNVLTVGKDAEIEADIYADDVVISGSVRGSISSDKVRLSNTANVKGSIEHRLFAIEAGAQFEGDVRHSEERLSHNEDDSGGDSGAAASSWSSPSYDDSTDDEEREEESA